MRHLSGGCDRFRDAVAMACRSHGVVTLAQLLAAGIPDTTVRSWSRGGRLRRLYRGVYAVGHDALRQEGRWLAAVLAFGRGAALSHASAAAALELRSSSAVIVDVSVPHNHRRQAGVRLHRPRALDPSELTVVSGIVVTDATRTLIDMARSHPASVVENVAATAQHRDLLDYARIDAHAPASLRQILGRGPKLSRARIERKLLAGLRAAAVTEPATNVWLTHGGGEQWEPDFLWSAERLIVELDDDTHRTARAFELDRAKDVIRQADGYLTPRFTLRQVDDSLPDVVAKIAQLLALRQGASRFGP